MQAKRSGRKTTVMRSLKQLVRLPPSPFPINRSPSTLSMNPREQNADMISSTGKHTQGLQVFAPKAPIAKKCPDPVALIVASQISALDPSGARTRLFLKSNPEAARVGDILLVRQRSGEPFAGVCINIRRRGVDTAILLRGQLTRVGVEMWFKVYSPSVEGIEVVQRAAKRARRARLTFMRQVKHDRGDVGNLVRGYLARKASLGGPEGGKKGMGGGGAHKAKKGGKGRGKKR